MSHPYQTIYEAIGPETFERLIAAFYEGVANDPLLRPLYPEDDLSGAADRLRMFVVQYFGGPDDYARLRGQPRLRLRHAPFRIGQAERDAWMTHMLHAIEVTHVPEPAASVLRDYFDKASTFMINAEPLGGMLAKWRPREA